MLLAVVAMGILASPAGAERQVFFSDGCQRSQDEPAEVVLACGDAKLRLVGLAWNRWDAHSATATGILTHPDFDHSSCRGKPAVACTVYSETAATVRVWRPVKCPSNGLWQFTRLRVAAPEDPDPTVREVTREYRCSEFADASPQPKRPRRVFIRRGQAEAWMGTALSRREVFQFQSGNSRSVRCRQRLSRDRIRCRMSWSLGDEIHFHGHGTIWITYESGITWNYSYRVKGVNEFCLRVGGSGCRKTWVVR
ncbi:MAG TPA: hypothetical protein VD741_09690 [Solirubrobacterales bacterium]|nr:hypothetical protein [Solirubrobacterales bacterium]